MEIVTPDYLKHQISLNYQRVLEARRDNDPVLEEFFTVRTNRSLDEYGDMLKFAVKAAHFIKGEPSTVISERDPIVPDYGD